MANIKFGTDGWRAIIGEDFTQENVGIVTNAIGKYVFDTFGYGKKILIGYDPRNMAKEFATQCADLLCCLGFEVFLSQSVLPTPVLAYGAQFYNACAIMFTASHNPPQYLGMKFIPDYAGPATDKITDEIIVNLNKKLKPQDGGKIHIFDFKPKYFEHLKTLIDFDKIKNIKTNIIFDGLYSATIGYFDQFLDEYGIKYQSLHMEYDPNFGGGMPEPKPKYLKELIEKVKTYCPPPQPSPLKGGGRKLLPSINAIGLANDGDGDRFGIINENGEYVSPNEIISILLLYLKNNRKMQGPLVKTVGGSLLLDKVAEKIGVEIIETAVGFKHVGAAMRKFNPIIGGEESGGLSIQGHIPEKDGILANLLVLEAMGAKCKSLVELQEELYDFVGVKFFNELVNLKLKNCEQIRNSLEKAKNMTSIGDFKVIKTDLKDGVKLYLQDALGENSSWVLIRPSGTEPLLRIYFESDSLEKIKNLKETLKNNL